MNCQQLEQLAKKSQNGELTDAQARQELIKGVKEKSCHYQ